MDKKVFWSPRFDGGRFTNHTIPLEFLKDLMELQGLLEDLVRYEYRQKGKCVPSKIFRDASIHLESISTGSAIVSFVLMVAPGFLYHPLMEAFEKAKESIIETVNQAENGDEITAIPREFCARFDRLGRGLREDESIIFAPDRNTGKNGLYNQKNRETIVKSSTKLAILSKDIMIKGRISEVNTKEKKFIFDSLYDGKFYSKYSPELEKIIYTNLNRDDAEINLQLEATAVYKAEKFDYFSEIKSIIAVDEMDVSFRLNEFSDLKDGWLDGKGVAPSKKFLQKIDFDFEKYYPSDLSLPFLYPTGEGGVLAEWTSGDNEISLEINPNDYSAYFHSLNMKTDDEKYEDIILSKSGWEHFVVLLREQGAVNV